MQILNAYIYYIEILYKAFVYIITCARHSSELPSYGQSLVQASCS